MWERIIENATISVSKLKFDELGSFKSKFSRNEASSLDLFKYLTSESSKAHFHTREEGVNSNSGEKQAARPHFSSFMASNVCFSRKCGFEPNLFNEENSCSTSEEKRFQASLPNRTKKKMNYDKWMWERIIENATISWVKKM